MRIAVGALSVGAILVATTFGSGTMEDPRPSGREGRSQTERASLAALAGRFEREIWPMIAEPEDAGKACLACHRDDEANTSPLVFTGDPAEDFETLAHEGYLDRGNPASLLARIAHKNPSERMPPEPQPQWSRKEIDRLRTFVGAFSSAKAEEDRISTSGRKP